MKENPQSIGIQALAYRLPRTRKTVSELEKDGLLTSPASLLESFGFNYCCLEDDYEDLEELLLESGQDILNKNDVPKDTVSRIFLYSGIERQSGEDLDLLSLFRYPVSKIKQKLDLQKADAVAISQQGCSGLLSTIHLAKQLLLTSPSIEDSMMCLAIDKLPFGSKREIMYNVMSDAAATALVSKNCEKNEIIHFHQETQSYYWDTPKHEDELLASYFPMAKRVIEATLEEAGLSISDIKWFVPHNVSLRSWEILAKLLNIPMQNIWTKNISRVGHTVSSDHIINLVDMENENALNKGDYLVLFTFGFGASWSCLILKH